MLALSQALILPTRHGAAFDASPGGILKRIDNLTGIRAIAALWVVMCHLETNCPALGTIAKQGWLGVNIFYVLSGFVLSLVYATKLPPAFAWAWYWKFLSRRIAKIYPLHIITFCLIAGLVLIARHFHFQFVTNSENTLKLQSTTSYCSTPWV